jgi:hypothetical protein
MRIRSLALALVSISAVGSALAGPINYLGSSFSYSIDASTGLGGSFSNADAQVFIDDVTSSVVSSSSSELASASYQATTSYDSSTVSGASHAAAVAAATSPGASSATSQGLFVSYFDLTEDSIVDYGIFSGSGSYIESFNLAESLTEEDGFIGLFDVNTNTYIATSAMEGSVYGSATLSAGTYAVIQYSASFASASATNGSAAAYSASGTSFLLGAEAVPEPASMAVLALGAVAMLRRRRK